MTAWTYRCQSAGKAAQKIVPLRPRTPCWKGHSADSEEKREPVSDINTAMVDSLKVLDPKRPIRAVIHPSQCNACLAKADIPVAPLLACHRAPEPRRGTSGVNCA